MLFPPTAIGVLNDVAPVTSLRSMVPTFCKFSVVMAAPATPETIIDLSAPADIRFFRAATESNPAFSFMVLVRVLV